MTGEAAVETLPAGTPERSLGDHVVSWMERWLRSPADPRSPLELTAEQIRFLLWWYAVDGRGRWRYRRGILRRPKGWGKDPLCACICLAELLGPTRFDRFAAGGLAVGRPTPAAMVQVGAVSEAQTRTTTLLLGPLVSDDLRAAHQVDISDRRVKAVVDGMHVEMRPVTSSSRSAEGARVTAFISNEIQHWLRSNGGWAMSQVIRRNLAKSPDGAAREIAITNAHEPGEGSVAELDDEAWREQRDSGTAGDILLDTREPLLDSGFDLGDDAALRSALRCAYGDAHWIDLDRIMAECRDPRQAPAHVHRFFLNRLVAGARKWMDPSSFDACRRDDVGLGREGAAVAVGFDGSVTSDATAIVCTEMSTGYQWLAAVWEQDLRNDLWQVPHQEVRAVVETLFDRYDVVRMYCDPAWWQSDVWEWCGRWDAVAAFWMSASTRRRTARAVTGYRDAVHSGMVTWGGANADVLRRHVLAAVERPLQAHDESDRRLHTIGKPGRRSDEWIDAAVAAVLSWQARGDALADGWAAKPTTRAVRRRR